MFARGGIELAQIEAGQDIECVPTPRCRPMKAGDARRCALVVFAHQTVCARPPIVGEVVERPNAAVRAHAGHEIGRDRPP